MSTPEDILRIGDVAKRTSLGRSTVLLWVAQGRFPKPTALSKTIKVWRRSDIDKWIEGVFAGPSNQTAAPMLEEGNDLP